MKLERLAKSIGNIDAVIDAAIDDVDIDAAIDAAIDGDEEEKKMGE